MLSIFICSIQFNISTLKNSNYKILSLRKIQFYVKITKSENFLNDVWGDLKRYLTNYEKDSIIEENKDGIITEWICFRERKNSLELD